jgi:alcohol oxidase
VLPDDAEYISMANWTTYPYSRGTIHVTGPTMGDQVDFNTGWLTDANDIDLKKHVWAYKVTREMVRFHCCYSLERLDSCPLSCVPAPITRLPFF